MTAITYGAHGAATAENAKTAAPAKAEKVETAKKRPNFFRLMFDALVEARQMQAEAEVRRYRQYFTNSD